MRALINKWYDDPFVVDMINFRIRIVGISIFELKYTIRTRASRCANTKNMKSNNAK